MLYSFKRWVLDNKIHVDQTSVNKITVVEMKMFRWMSGNTTEDRIRNKDIGGNLGMALIEYKQDKTV